MESILRSKDIPSVAVIGTGYWGKNLVRNFHQIGALRMICDKNETVWVHLQDSACRAWRSPMRSPMF